MASPFDANMQRKDLSRVRGFQSPYTLDQMTTWVLQPAASILFNVLCAHMLPGAKVELVDHRLYNSTVLVSMDTRAIQFSLRSADIWMVLLLICGSFGR